MSSFASPARGALRIAMTAGAVAVSFAAASLAGTAPAEARIHHGGHHHPDGYHHGFHRLGGISHHLGGFGHHAFGYGHRGFGYGAGRHIGHYGFGHQAFGYGYRRFGHGYRGYGLRGFGDGLGLPYRTHAGRLCPIGRHFVYGLGCRRNLVRYGYVAPAPVYAFRYGFGRIIHPRVRAHGLLWRSGTFGYGFRHFGHGGHRLDHRGFHHARFGGGYHGHVRRG